MANPERPGASWALDPRATSGFVLACALLIVVNVAAYFLVAQLTAASSSAARHEAVLQSAQRVLRQLLEAESGQRGYVITGDETYLEAYEAALRDLDPALATLRQTVGDDPAWQTRLDRLAVLLDRKRRDLETSIHLRTEAGSQAALRAERTGDGNTLTEEIRRVVSEGTDAARQGLDSNFTATHAGTRYLYAGIVVANVLALILLAGAVLLVNRTAAKRQEVAAALRQSHEQLETRVRQRTLLLSRVNDVLQVEIAQHRSSEERASRLAALVEFSEDAIIGLDFDGSITSWNPAAERLCGYGADEACGQPLSLLVPPGRADEDASLISRVRRGESVRPFETVRLRKDGTEIQVSLSVGPVRDAGGQVVGAAAVVRDITELHKLAGQLRQASKMEAVGRLAAGVAHDFNNLLTVILGSCDLLLNDMPAAAPERPVLQEIAKAGDRATALTRQLLAFSRQQPLALCAFDLNQVVDSMSRMLPRLLGSDIQLAVVLSAGPATVFADPGQVEQVLLNLAANARDAMPRGGELTVETQCLELDEPFARVHEGLRPGPHMQLTVIDTGCGMTEDVRAHLFEPFFTTKEKGKGTGLGLAMVYGIVKQSGGHIAVHSEPDRGTNIQIFLPLREEPGPSGHDAPPVPVAGGSETVLLVEDDESVRSLLVLVLRQHGYRVLEAEDGPAALQTAAAHEGPIHLLVIDVVMPGISGRDVSDQLVQLRPSLKVLFLSGYSDHAVVRQGVVEAALPFLAKPFTPDAMARKVRAVLDGKAE